MPFRIGLLAVLLQLTSAGHAVAQVAAEHSGMSSSGGMPQLAFNNPWTIAQVVWMAVIFGLLYYVMARYALPQVAGVLEERRRRIDGDLEAAQQAKTYADAALAEHRAATARARAEAQSAIAQAAQQAQAEAAARADALNARLAEQIAAAERRIDAAREAAMGALQQVATETTDALVTRLIGSVDRAGLEQAVLRELAGRNLPTGRPAG
jgi:F-type H+-transporting ATPase subunit b